MSALIIVFTLLCFILFHTDYTPVSDSGTLLRQLGTPDGAKKVSSITVYGPDGPMPEIATRSFSLSGTAQIARDFYKRRCQTILLDLPEKDILKIEPAAICQRKDRLMTVYLYQSCTILICDISIQIRNVAG